MRCSTRQKSEGEAAGPSAANPFPRKLGKVPYLTFAILLVTAIATAAVPGMRLEAEGIAGGRAILSLDANRLRTMTPTPFHLMLTDGSGTPIAGAEVRCDLTMPAMPMPENRPLMQEKNGLYWGEAIFTMAGKWQAAFSVLLPDGRLEIIIFDLDRVLLR